MELKHLVCLPVAVAMGLLGCQPTTPESVTPGRYLVKKVTLEMGFSQADLQNLGKTITFDYNANGLLTQFRRYPQDSIGTTLPPFGGTLRYDDMGRLSRVTVSNKLDRNVPCPQ